MKTQSVKPKAQSLKANILENRQIAQRIYRMSLLAPAIAKSAKPGQFIMVHCGSQFKPLLRRPLSIHNAYGKNIEILYEVVGEATEILAQKKQGDVLDIIGPSGNGFDLKAGHNRHGVKILIAGGIGVAPLVFLAEKLMERKAQSAKRKVLVLIGAKTKKHIFCEKEFKKSGCEVKIATDDGSKGFKGFVSNLLVESFSNVNPFASRGIGCQVSAIYACGPRPMLQKIGLISNDYKIPAQISMEEHMSCGFGACLGCVINTKHGYKRVCKEGPVFDARELEGVCNI